MADGELNAEPDAGDGIILTAYEDAPAHMLSIPGSSSAGDLFFTPIELDLPTPAVAAPQCANSPPIASPPRSPLSVDERILPSRLMKRSTPQKRRAAQTPSSAPRRGGEDSRARRCKRRLSVIDARKSEESVDGGEGFGGGLAVAEVQDDKEVLEIVCSGPLVEETVKSAEQFLTATSLETIDGGCNNEVEKVGEGVIEEVIEGRDDSWVVKDSIVSSNLLDEVLQFECSGPSVEAVVESVTQDACVELAEHVAAPALETIDDEQNKRVATVEDELSGKEFSDGFRIVECHDDRPREKVSSVMADSPGKEILVLDIEYSGPSVDGIMNLLHDASLELAEHFAAATSLVISEGSMQNAAQFVDDALHASLPLSLDDDEKKTLVMVEDPQMNIAQVGSTVLFDQHSEGKLKPLEVQQPEKQQHRAVSPSNQGTMSERENICDVLMVQSNQVEPLTSFPETTLLPLKCVAHDGNTHLQSAALIPRPQGSLCEMPQGTRLLEDNLQILVDVDCGESNPRPFEVSIEEHREAAKDENCDGTTVPSIQRCSAAKQAQPVESLMPLSEKVILPMIKEAMNGNKKAHVRSLAQNEGCCTEMPNGALDLEGIPKRLDNANAEQWKPSEVEYSMQGRRLATGNQICDASTAPSNQGYFGPKRACQHRAKDVNKPQTQHYGRKLLESIIAADVDDPAIDLFKVAKSIGIVFPKLSWWEKEL